tara:strand:+ start:1283 stop:1672 length:390 start_codon:yes stop_codon:yes gene_type:complete
LYIYRENYFLDELIKKEDDIELLSLDSSDLIKPKFSINRKKDNITVSANEGNFVTKDKILLNSDVQFKTEDFKITSNKATFNKKHQTASSDTLTEFQSEGTIISSQGFNITNSGNTISFKGKTKITLSK